MDVLSPSILPKINKVLLEIGLEIIDEILNIFNMLDLISYIKEKDNYKIIPLLESHMQELCNANIKNVVMANFDIIYKFSNKKLFTDYVRENDLESYVPLTYQNFDQIPSDSLLIVKPFCNSNGYGMEIKNRITKNEFRRNIIQKYIENIEEYVSHIVAIDGKIIHCITYNYIFDKDIHIKVYPVNTNNTKKVEISKYYIDIMEKFLSKCSYNGMCNIDFVITKEGDIKIFEINPRLGGSMIRNNNEDLIYTIIKLLF